MKAFLLAAGVGSPLGRSPIRPRSACWSSAGSRCSTSGSTRSTARASTRFWSTCTTCRTWYGSTSTRGPGPPPCAPSRAGTPGQRRHARRQPGLGRREGDVPRLLRRQPHRFELRSLVQTHREHGGIATLTVFHSERPSAGGVVELDAAGTVVGFAEKPSQPVSDLVNAGMYAFHPRVLDEIGGPPPRDIGYDLLPRLVGRAKAMPVDGYFRDVGTVDAYRRARQEWPARAATGARTRSWPSRSQAAKPPTIRLAFCTTSQAWPTAGGRDALWTSDLFRASPVPCFSGRARTGMSAVSSAAPSMRT